MTLFEMLFLVLNMKVLIKKCLMEIKMSIILYFSSQDIDHTLEMMANFMFVR